MTVPALSIVIVTFNARDDVQRCLASLYEAPPTRSWDLVVVDNASTDGTPDAIEAAWPDAQLVRLPRNVGFAAGNNVGIRATTGTDVLLLNSDTLVQAAQIDRLCHALDEDPAVGAAGPRLVDADGRPELSFGRMISPLAELRQKCRGRVLRGGPARWRARIEHELTQARYVDWVSGACLLVRRTAAERVGLLDERYFMYCEDVDFCAALRAAGYRVLFAPQAAIAHVRGRSRATAPAATSARYRASQLAFYRKHHPRWAPLLRLYLAIVGRRAGW